jgi:hypothetical protein
MRTPAPRRLIDDYHGRSERLLQWWSPTCNTHFLYIRWVSSIITRMYNNWNRLRTSVTRRASQSRTLAEREHCESAGMYYNSIHSGTCLRVARVEHPSLHIRSLMHLSVPIIWAASLPLRSISIIVAEMMMMLMKLKSMYLVASEEAEPYDKTERPALRLTESTSHGPRSLLRWAWMDSCPERAVGWLT